MEAATRRVGSGDAEDGREVIRAGDLGDCVDADGRPEFYSLMFKRALPVFYAFDVLWAEGEDLRELPLRDAWSCRAPGGNESRERREARRTSPSREAER